MSTENVLLPSQSLTSPANPDSGQKSQFILFSESWLELQVYMGAALELPITEGSFSEKYGSFSGEKIITDCVGAMKDVQSASTEFGDPKALRRSLIDNPGLLATAEPPQEIYTHTVWMGQKVHNTAQSLKSGFKSVLDALPGLPAKDQVENLKAYLFDQSLGPISLSQTMSKEVGDLIVKLGRFEEKMNAYNAKLQAFTGQSSQMIQLVNTSIGSIEQKIKELEKTRDEAYKAWRDFTIAAAVSSVGAALIGAALAPFTGGVSLLVGGAAAIALAAGLGTKAAQNRAAYNAAVKLIREQGVELRKKTRLRSDLGDFNTAMGRVGPAMGSFLKNLQTIQGVWTQMNADMIAIGNSVTESNVGSLPFLVRAKAQAAIDAWDDIDTSAKQFTVGSLVDYTSIAFGDPLPESAAA